MRILCAYCSHSKLLSNPLSRLSAHHAQGSVAGHRMRQMTGASWENGSRLDGLALPIDGLYLSMEISFSCVDPSPFY
jgi:hypothetical protein